jgi:hypothetical protein
MEDDWPTEFEPEELKEFHARLRCGEVLDQPDHMGGCHTYVRDVRDPNRMWMETLVTYDGLHFTMGIGKHQGCRVIAETSPEDIVQWYNEVHGTDVKFVRLNHKPGYSRNVIVDTQ